MAETLTHWKKLQNPNYLGSYAFLPSEEKILTISKAGQEMVVGSDGKKEECAVIHFKEKDVKPMILNVTNSKTIEMVAKTPYIEEWIGRKITVYVATIRAFGEEMEALRIRPKAPVSNKPILDQNYTGWQSAYDAISKGETTIEFLEKNYQLTPDSKKALLEAVPNA